MTAIDVDRTRVELKIAELIEQHTGVERSRVLSGDSFLDLHSDFDSLTMFEICGMLEEHYGIHIEIGGVDERIPSNVHELADVVLKYLAEAAPSSSPNRTPLSPASGAVGT